MTRSIARKRADTAWPRADSSCTDWHQRDTSAMLLRVSTCGAAFLCLGMVHNDLITARRA